MAGNTAGSRHLKIFPSVIDRDAPPQYETSQAKVKNWTKIFNDFLFSSEEKAQLLRSVLSEVESKDSALDVFLSSLSLSEVPKPG